MSLRTALASYSYWFTNVWMSLDGCNRYIQCTYIQKKQKIPHFQTCVYVFCETKYLLLQHIGISYGGWNHDELKNKRNAKIYQFHIPRPNLRGFSFDSPTSFRCLYLIFMGMATTSTIFLFLHVTAEQSKANSICIVQQYNVPPLPSASLHPPLPLLNKTGTV